MLKFQLFKSFIVLHSEDVRKTSRVGFSNPIGSEKRSSVDAWKAKANVYAQSNDPGFVRGDMALDLVATNLLDGKEILEVKSLLGEPDITKEGTIYYDIGQCSGFGWHDSVLQVGFSHEQKVSSAAIVRH